MPTQTECIREECTPWLVCGNSITEVQLTCHKMADNLFVMVAYLSSFAARWLLWDGIWPSSPTFAKLSRISASSQHLYFMLAENCITALAQVMQRSVIFKASKHGFEVLVTFFLLNWSYKNLRGNQTRGSLKRREKTQEHMHCGMHLVPEAWWRTPGSFFLRCWSPFHNHHSFPTCSWCKCI